MNEELIIRTMTENGVTREKAIEMITNNQQGLNSVESQFASAYTGMQSSPFQATYSPQGIEVPTGYMNNDVLKVNRPQETTQSGVLEISPLLTDTNPMNTNRGSVNWDALSPQRTDINVPQGGFVPMNTSPLQRGDMRVDVTANNGQEVELGEVVETEGGGEQSKDLNFLEQSAIFASQLNPYGTDLESALYSFGEGMGRAQNGQGGAANTIGMIGAAGKAILGGTRSALSGYSTQIANNRYLEWMQERQRKKGNVYSAQSQTGNTQADMLGGTTQN